MEERLVATRMLAAGLVLGLAVLTSPARADDKTKENAKGRLEAARKVYEGVFQRARVDPSASLDPDKLALWSRRWAEAERDLGDTKEEKIAAVQGHLDRMKKLEGLFKAMRQSALVSPTDVAAQEYYRLEAEQWLTQAKEK
jgi:hypothetical protein